MLEASRIEELERYEILDTPTDGAFEDICRIATMVFKVPVAIISLVDTDRVWFGASVGVGETREIGRGPGLCASAILSKEVYVANDLREDPNSLSNPLVASENGFRFYAAAPLTSRNGYNLGTMCVLDFKPSTFDDEDRMLLESLARMVMTHMEQRLASREIASLARELDEKNRQLAHLASHDALTGLKNRAKIETVLSKALAQTESTVAVMAIDVDFFKSINDTYGHQAGDCVLRELSVRMQGAVRAQDEIGRFGGEEFLIVASGLSGDEAADLAERVRGAVCAEPFDIGGTRIQVSVSIGLCLASPRQDTAACIRLADKALYDSKAVGRNCVTVVQAESVVMSAAE